MKQHLIIIRLAPNPRVVVTTVSKFFITASTDIEAEDFKNHLSF
jgi:hypothetical protein